MCEDFDEKCEDKYMLSQEEIENLLEYVEENSPETHIRRIATEISELLIKKNHDYGDDNLTRRGLIGIIIRIEDKLSRLENLKDKQGLVRESLEDTLKDIAGYAINAIRLLREEKI